MTVLALIWALLWSGFEPKVVVLYDDQVQCEYISRTLNANDASRRYWSCVPYDPVLNRELYNDRK